jgi:hypothetical protein
LPVRYVDPENAKGNLPEGQTLFAGVSDEVIEVGLAFSQIYDPVAELQRIRAIFARQAGSHARPRAVAFNQHRSLRRV